MPDETARMVPWDGSPTGRCDHIGCTAQLVIHAELTAPGTEYAAEVDLCEEHLPALVEQGRSFLVALGVIKPASETERNVAAAVREHL